MAEAMLGVRAARSVDEAMRMTSHKEKPIYQHLVCMGIYLRRRDVVRRFIVFCEYLDSVGADAVHAAGAGRGVLPPVGLLLAGYWSARGLRGGLERFPITLKRIQRWRGSLRIRLRRTRPTACRCASIDR